MLCLNNDGDDLSNFLFSNLFIKFTNLLVNQMNVCWLCIVIRVCPHSFYLFICIAIYFVECVIVKLKLQSICWCDSVNRIIKMEYIKKTTNDGKNCKKNIKQTCE